MSRDAAKITMVGCGAIGSAAAQALLLRREGIELLLVNRDGRRAWAKAYDMSHCAPELPGRSVRSGTIEESEGSDVIVMTAGVLPRADGTRADVLRDNVEVYGSLVPALAKSSPRAVFIVVANPVDAIAYAAWRFAGSPAGRVLGSGTALDAMRLRAFIAEAYGLEAERTGVEVIGEHGDSMVPLWGRATYGGRPLAELLAERGADFGEAAKAELLRKTKRAGWEIRQGGEHSCYGIAFSLCRIVETILGFSEGPVAVAAPFAGEYGIEGAFMSLPTMLGRGGVVSRIAPELSGTELEALRASADAVRAQTDEVDRLIGKGAVPLIY